MLLISIVDNKGTDAQQLHDILDGYFRRTGTAYVERIYQSGIEFIQSSEPSDIVFMDIQMDKLDGLETARIMRKLGSQAQLIFITKAADRAIQGYEVDALDYLLKPAAPAAVTTALDKAMNRMERMTSTSLALKLQNGITTISSNDITYVEVFDHNLVFHTTRGEFNVRGRLSKVYESLNPEHFILCNRSFLVNLRYVTGIWSDHLTVGSVKIAVSKSHRKEISSRFAAYLEKK